jgi:hypothetical protein
MAMSDAIADWIAGLARRGISVTVVNNRLRTDPPKAYAQLTDIELLFLRHNKVAIKLAVVNGSVALSDAPPTPPQEIHAPTTEQPAQPSTDAHCEYCRYSLARCAALKDTRLDIWRLLHFRDPEEIARKNREATEVMLCAVPPPWWYR